MGIECAQMPAGSFRIGSSSGARWEHPLRRLWIPEAFYPEQCEVTQAQWEAVTGSRTSRFSGCGAVLLGDFLGTMPRVYLETERD